ncbi:DUF1080 domain-containing protein [Flavobacteriaceae bacterium]|nr:DUF1080 domain-containing protein [Flavobacteriaceae bacterium]
MIKIKWIKIHTLLLLLFPLIVLSQTNWIQLFNGKNFDGWEIKQGKADFEILNNGVIQATSILNSPSTYMGTINHYDDFIFEYEIFASSGLNSGVQFRSLNSKKGDVFGYQCELDTDEFRSWTGGIYDQSRRGLFLYPLTRNEKGKNAFKNGVWNKVRIEAVGRSIRTWVNGIQCSNLLDDTSKSGFIALQIHSINTVENKGKVVRWKNLRISTTDIEKNRWPVESYATEINYIDNYLSDDQISKGWRFLWDGETTNGWRGAKLNTFPKNGWIIKDGLLKVIDSGGKESEAGGDIVTKKKFSNFELELDFMITKGANSGIKYFVDTEMNQGKGSSIGLEFQILDDKNHPDAKEGVLGNRTVASLYDLITAENLQESRGKRNVKPNTWHRARIFVDGGHVEHWLDNIKMLEYDRYSQVFKSLVNYSKYQKWPGFGLLDAGHILLQDHGDEVYFKNIKVREF